MQETASARTDILPAPDINDPRLDEPIPYRPLHPAEAMTPEEMLAALDAPPPEYKPITPLARALHSVGLTRKAQRVDRCGITRRFRGCGCGKEGKQSQTCMSKSCRPCSRKLLRKRVDKFFSNMRYIAPLDYFYAIRIVSSSQKEHPAKEEIQAFKSFVGLWIKAHCPNVLGTGAFFFCTVEQAADGWFSMSARILWWQEGLSAEARHSAPGMLSYTKLPAGGRSGDGQELLKALEQMFDWQPPSDPTLAAKYEKETAGLRLICHYGYLLKKGYTDPSDTAPAMDAEPIASAQEYAATTTEESEGSDTLTPDDSASEQQLIASEPAIATNCQECASTASKPGKNCCPDCMTRYTEVSEWHDPYLPAAEISSLTWYPLPEG